MKHSHLKNILVYNDCGISSLESMEYKVNITPIKPLCGEENEKISNFVLKMFLQYYKLQYLRFLTCVTGVGTGELELTIM